MKVIQLKGVEAGSESHLRGDRPESVRPVVVNIRRPGDLDSYSPPPKKAALAFDVDDVTGRDWNAARSQLKNLASRFVHYRDHTDLRPARGTNEDIQADVCNHSRGGVE
ncbi:MAG: hypothetical protein ABSG59_16870 [Verrucomicrobiota bacterium]